MERWEYRLQYEEGFLKFLQELIEWEQIEGAALGIAKQVLDKGLESLSEQQDFVFRKYVVEANFVDRCKRCGNEIAWHEMVFAHRNGGFCEYCEHMRNRASESD